MFTLICEKCDKKKLNRFKEKIKFNSLTNGDPDCICDKCGHNCQFHWIPTSRKPV